VAEVYRDPVPGMRRVRMARCRVMHFAQSRTIRARLFYSPPCEGGVAAP
jgi:hypothetical protein